MSSVQTYIAQPKTRKFVVANPDGQGQGARFFAQSDFNTWVTANGSKIVQNGSLYIIPGTSAGSTFVDVLRGLNGATELEHSLTEIERAKTLIDLGRTITIGIPSQSQMLVFRLVQKFAPTVAANSATDPDYTGYVVVENNSEDLNNLDNHRFSVRVARI
jgi:hypothetical protein